MKPKLSEYWGSLCTEEGSEEDMIRANIYREIIMACSEHVLGTDLCNSEATCWNRYNDHVFTLKAQKQEQKMKE